MGPIPATGVHGGDGGASGGCDSHGSAVTLTAETGEVDGGQDWWWLAVGKQLRQTAAEIPAGLNSGDREIGSVQPGPSQLNRTLTTGRGSSNGPGVAVHGGDRRWQAVMAGGRCSGTHGSTGNRTSRKGEREKAAEQEVGGGETELDGHSRRRTVGSGGRTDGGELGWFRRKK